MDAIKTFPKFTLFFIALIILEVLGLTVIPTYHVVSKPMILAGLIGFYIMEEKRQDHAFLTALIFALLGDSFLLFDTDDMFIIGLSCFLIMQICYTVTFNKRRRIPRTKDYIVPGGLALLGIAVLAFLWQDLGDLKLAVTLYTTAIVTMAAFAYLRHPKLRGHGSLFFGVCLFIVSDGLLAVNKFGEDIPFGQIAVMLTYMLAQYFIVTGEVLGKMPPLKAKAKVDPNRSFTRHKQ